MTEKASFCDDDLYSLARSALSLQRLPFCLIRAVYTSTMSTQHGVYSAMFRLSTQPPGPTSSSASYQPHISRARRRSNRPHQPTAATTSTATSPTTPTHTAITSSSSSRHSGSSASVGTRKPGGPARAADDAYSTQSAATTTAGRGWERIRRDTRSAVRLPRGTNTHAIHTCMRSRGNRDAKPCAWLLPGCHTHTIHRQQHTPSVGWAKQIACFPHQHSPLTHPALPHTLPPVGGVGQQRRHLRLRRRRAVGAVEYGWIQCTAQSVRHHHGSVHVLVAHCSTDFCACGVCSCSTRGLMISVHLAGGVGGGFQVACGLAGL